SLTCSNVKFTPARIGSRVNSVHFCSSPLRIFWRTLLIENGRSSVEVDRIYCLCMKSRRKRRSHFSRLTVAPATEIGSSISHGRRRWSLLDWHGSRPIAKLEARSSFSPNEG